MQLAPIRSILPQSTGFLLLHGLRPSTPPLLRRHHHSSLISLIFSEVVNTLATSASGQHPLTVFGYEDYHLQLTENVNIVIREESELNIMYKAKQRNQKGSTSYMGKGKGMENQVVAVPVSWDDKAIEFQRIHSTKNRGWGRDNMIFIATHFRWSYCVGVDSFTFRKFMYRKYGGYR